MLWISLRYVLLAIGKYNLYATYYFTTLNLHIFSLIYHRTAVLKYIFVVEIMLEFFFEWKKMPKATGRKEKMSIMWQQQITDCCWLPFYLFPEFRPKLFWVCLHSFFCLYVWVQGHRKLFQKVLC